ncbi:MAG: hypothetical protein HYY96_04435 [Candidatus Tectomicrobia bacterium]|nr:hypothetical protein [Candidatus Tectomicrobia bacterium]
MTRVALPSLRRRFFLAAVALTLLCGAGARAQQGEPVGQRPAGVIHGSVTLEGQPLAGKQVVLYVLRRGEEETRSFTRTESTGAFQFDRIKTDPSYSYVAAAEHEGVSYQSQPLTFAIPELKKEVELKVAHTTTSDADISVAREHSILDFASGKLLVTTVLMARNGGSRAYIGFEQVGLGRREVLKLPLPVGFKNFQLLQGGTTQEVELADWGGSYTRPMPPGVVTLAYRYELPVKGEDLTFTRKVAYQTGQLDVLVAMAGNGGEMQGMPGMQGPPSRFPQRQSSELRIASTTLADQGLLDMQGRQVRRLSGQGLQKGSAISLTIAGLTPAGFWTRHSSIAYGIIVLIILGGMLVPLISAKRRKQAQMADRPVTHRPQQRPAKNRAGAPENGAQAASKGAAAGRRGAERPAREPKRSARREEGPAVRREELYEALVAIEEQRQAGAIAEQSYELQREELRRELKDLLRATPPNLA